MKSNFHLLFYLRKQKNHKDGPMAIYMRITVNGKRADMSAGRECEPAKWNSRAGRAISIGGRFSLFLLRRMSLQSITQDFNLEDYI